jgi:type IV fimbrial biogenesis protein FimT
MLRKINNIPLRTNMPIASLSRRDPHYTGNGFSTKRGFTVIELMVAVAVIAIITSLALPSYRALIEKRQVTSGAEQIAAFLSAVQIESVMRNESMTVSYDRADVDSWCIGLISGSAACDCTVANSCTVPDSAGTLVERVLAAGNLTYPGVMDSITGSGSFTFDPVRGVLVNPANVVEMELLSTGGNFALNVDVGPTGRVRICSGSPSAQVPGYAQC